MVIIINATETGKPGWNWMSVGQLWPNLRLTLNACWLILAQHQADNKCLLASTGPISDWHWMYTHQELCNIGPTLHWYSSVEEDSPTRYWYNDIATIAVQVCFMTSQSKRFFSLLTHFSKVTYQNILMFYKLACLSRTYSHQFVAVFDVELSFVLHFACRRRYLYQNTIKQLSDCHNILIGLHLMFQHGQINGSFTCIELAFCHLISEFSMWITAILIGVAVLLITKWYR